MFDLFRSREKVTRYLLGALLLAVAASMVTYLIPNTGFITSSTGADTTVVAEVGDQKVTSDEVRNVVDRLVTSGQLPRDAAEVYLPQVVDQMVQDDAVVYSFEKMGLRVSDDEVLAGFMAVYPQLFQNGKLISTDQLAQMLDQQHQTLAEGIDSMRRQLLSAKIQNIIATSVIVTPQEVDQAIERKHETVRVDYIAFPPAKFRDQVKVTPEDLRKAYDSNKAAYTIPEKRSFQVLLLDQKKMEEAMTVTDAQLRQAYASNMDSMRTPERVKVRHILLMTEGKSDAEKKQILAKAQDLLKQIKGGADFAEVAKKNSQDPGSAPNGGELGFIVRGQTVPEFEKFIFSAKPKEISDIVTTQYGYHIIQVEEKEPARVKPFDEVKESLAEQIKKQSVNDKMQTAADQIRAALLKDPASGAEVAKQNGAELVDVKDAEAGAPIPGIGPSPEIDQQLAAMKPNDVSEPLVLSGNRMAVVVLKQKTAPRPAEFNEVEAKVRDQYITTQSTILANEAARKAAERIKAGEDMAAVAKSLKLEVTKSSDVTRNDSVEGLGPAESLSDAFTKPVGTVIGPTPVAGRNIVYKIMDRKTPDPKNFGYERDVALQELKQQKARAMYELFQDSVLEQLRKDGKLKIHQDAVKQLAASYRSR
jgi:peptidyl-prolyl cis-trans isomerase D